MHLQLAQLKQGQFCVVSQFRSDILVLDLPLLSSILEISHSQT